MAQKYKNVVKGGKFYHVYNKGGKQVFRYIRKASGNNTGGTQAPDVNEPSAQQKALMSALGMDDVDPEIFGAAKTLTDAKLNPQIQAINSEIGKQTGANKYLSDRMAKYAQMYQGQVNQAAAANAAGANAAPTLQASTGDAAYDAALRNSIAARTQGNAAMSGTIASVAGMRANDQQSQLAQQFQAQLNDLQTRRMGIEQSRGGEELNALQGLVQQRSDAEAKKFEQQAAAQALGLKIDTAEEAARHNKAGERNTAAGIKQRAQTAENALTSKERLEQRKLESKEREGRLNRAQKERLAELKAKGKSGGGFNFVSDTKQASEDSKVSGIVSDVKAHKDKFRSRRDSVKAYLAAHPGSDELYVSIAHDIAFDGHISRANARKLHDRHLKVKGIGKSYSEYVHDQRNTGAARTGGN